MSKVHDAGSVALFLTIGFGKIGEEVARELTAFRHGLPDVLQLAWRIVVAESSENAETLNASKKQTREVKFDLLSRENISAILREGYGLEGRRSGSEIRISNVYVWSSSEYGSDIPAFVREAIQSNPSEVHVGFCYEEAESPVDTKSMEINPIFSYYIVQDSLSTGEKLKRDGVVSSIAGAILMGFMPNNRFDLAKDRGKIATIGFAGRYGLMWASRNNLIGMISDRTISYQTGRDDRKVKTRLLSTPAKEFLDLINPANIGIKLFDSQSAEISEKNRIPAEPAWSSDSFIVEMYEGSCSKDLDGVEKAEWPNQIRRYLLTFGMSSVWKWGTVLNRAFVKLTHRVKRKFLPEMHGMLDEEIQSPAYVRELMAQTKLLCSAERRVGNRGGDVNWVESKIGKLKQKIRKQVDPVAYFLRLFIWLFPLSVSLVLLGKKLSVIEDDSNYFNIAIMTIVLILMLAGFRFHSRVKKSEQAIYDARKESLDAAMELEAACLAKDAIDKMEMFASEVASLAAVVNNDIDRYLLNMSTFVKKVRSEFDRIGDRKYAVLSPILESADEYNVLLDDVMHFDPERALSRIVSDTDIMKGIYRSEWDIDVFNDALYKYFKNELENKRIIENVPSIKGLLRLKSEMKQADGEKSDYKLSTLLRNLLSYTTPMTTRNIGSQEIVIGVPGDLYAEATGFLEDEGILSGFSVADMGDYSLVFCVSRSLIQETRGGRL